VKAALYPFEWTGIEYRRTDVFGFAMHHMAIYDVIARTVLYCDGGPLPSDFYSISAGFLWNVPASTSTRERGCERGKAGCRSELGDSLPFRGEPNDLTVRRLPPVIEPDSS
jgi:hypothetical protein